MKTYRMTAWLRWGSIDRQLAEFVCCISEDQLEEAGAFMRLLVPNGVEVEVKRVADTPVVVTREGGK